MKKRELLLSAVGSGLTVAAWTSVHFFFGGKTTPWLVLAALLAHFLTGQAVNHWLPPTTRGLVALRALTRYPRALLLVGIVSSDMMAWSPLGLVAAMGLALPGAAGEFALNGRGLGTLLLAAGALLAGGALVIWTGPQLGWPEPVRLTVALAHLCGVLAAFLAWRKRSLRPGPS